MGRRLTLDAAASAGEAAPGSGGGRMRAGGAPRHLRAVLARRGSQEHPSRLAAEEHALGAVPSYAPGGGEGGHVHAQLGHRHWTDSCMRTQTATGHESQQVPRGVRLGDGLPHTLALASKGLSTNQEGKAGLPPPLGQGSPEPRRFRQGLTRHFSGPAVPPDTVSSYPPLTLGRSMPATSQA